MTRSLFTATALLSSALLASAETQKMCRQFQNLTSSTGRYNMGTNQWGADGSGGECVFYDPSAQPEANATAFTTTWQWTNNLNLVHAYPNVYYQSNQFPTMLNNTHTFEVSVGWTYGLGNNVASEVETTALTNSGMKANVAFDLFLDFDQTKASNASSAAYEFMVWLGAFGGAQPLGYETTQSPMKYMLGGEEFTLYSADNTNGQHVYSWYPTNGNIGNFTGDINQLLQYTVEQQLLPDNIYLGSIQFGSECTHATSNVTFQASPVMMDMTVYQERSAALSRATASMTLLLASLGLTLYFGVL